jgi:hypothetical protein
VDRASATASTPAATASSTTPCTWRPSPRSATTRPGGASTGGKIEEGKTNREALRALKRRISDAVWHQLMVDAARQ